MENIIKGCLSMTVKDIEGCMKLVNDIEDRYYQTVLEVYEKKLEILVGVSKND